MSDRWERRLVTLFCLLTDGLIVWFALAAATFTRADTLVYLDSIHLLTRDHAACVVVFLFGLWVARAYHPARITDRFDSVYFAWVGLGVTAVFLLAVSRMLPDKTLAISGRELILGPVLAGLAFVMWRYTLGGIAARFRSLHRFFYVLGPEEEGRRIASQIAEKTRGLIGARYVALPELRDELERSDEAAAAPPFLRKDAIIAGTDANRESALDHLEFCEANFPRTYLYPALHDMLFFKGTKLIAVAGVPLIEVANKQLGGPYTYLKRLFDIAAALGGLLAASPICLVTALAIKLTSPGPLFYVQERMGQYERRFNLYKFRSMVTDAEARTGPMWATAADDRVTPVGRFIRKHRVDEIPQLLNVLKGDMSLIGPRPERPHFHREFCEKWPLFNRRLAVRPGVTSLSHVLGSYDSNPEDRLRYDLMYISSMSLALDVKIAVATVRVVLGAKGAQ